MDFVGSVALVFVPNTDDGFDSLNVESVEPKTEAALAGSALVFPSAKSDPLGVVVEALNDREGSVEFCGAGKPPMRPSSDPGPVASELCAGSAFFSPGWVPVRVGVGTLVDELLPKENSEGAEGFELLGAAGNPADGAFNPNCGALGAVPVDVN